MSYYQYFRRTLVVKLLNKQLLFSDQIGFVPDNFGSDSDEKSLYLIVFQQKANSRITNAQSEPMHTSTG